MITPRMRKAAVASSAALALSMAASSLAVAQGDGPESTFYGLADAIEVQDFASLSTYFCAEQSESLGGIGLDQMAFLMPVQMGMFTDLLTTDVDVETAEVVDQSEAEAIVEVEATISMGFDTELVTGLIEMITSSGLVPEEELEAMEWDLDELPESIVFELSGPVTMVPGEAMPWVICSDLSALVDDDMADDMDDDDSDDDETDDESDDDGE